jgi:Na+/H+-dicarboxylate symporter
MTQSRTAALFSSLSIRVLLALAAGLAAGAAAQTYGIPGGTGTVALIEGLGQLWLNALRMTVIPLVFALLVTGIASIADAAATGRLVGRLGGQVIGYAFIVELDFLGGRGVLGEAPVHSIVHY